MGQVGGLVKKYQNYIDQIRKTNKFNEECFMEMYSFMQDFSDLDLMHVLQSTEVTTKKNVFLQ
jgi:hypothetical protein